MKIDEIIKENTDVQHGRDMRDALSDMAMQELVSIEENPMEYFSSRGEEVTPEQAQQISQTLASVDDRTFDIISQSRIVVGALEANSMGDGQSYIDLNSFMEVMQKVQDRQQKTPNDERIGHDAGRPGHDDNQAYDKPPMGSGIR